MVLRLGVIAAPLCLLGQRQARADNATQHLLLLQIDALADVPDQRNAIFVELGGGVEFAAFLRFLRLG